MSQIVKQLIHETGSQDASNYLQFLVKEGYRLSLVTQEQLETIQFQIAELLANRFNRWTGGMSSSVPVETGHKIQQSVFYTIGYDLKSLGDADCALAQLKTRQLKDLFEDGLRLLESGRNKAELLLHRIREQGFPTDIIAYHDTIQDGLGLFFSSYDIDFGAHESPGSIDYPLGNDKMNLAGLEYVEMYLRKLQMEHEFCSLFSSDDIHSLFRGYDKQYRELLFNMYDLVFINAVGSHLLGRNEASLCITGLDRRYLQSMLGPLTNDIRSLLVDDAVAKMRITLSIEDPELISYLNLSSVNLKTRLNAALENHRLELLFLSFEGDQESRYILFHDNPPMEDNRFRELAETLRECRLTSDKLKLMMAETLNITDIVDLLEGDCFFAGEYFELFSKLEDLRLTLLAQKLPAEPTNQTFLREEFDQPWQFHLESFLMQMDPQRKSSILNDSGLIRVDSPPEQSFC